jgi:transcriptional regulator of acetoin/glycerol metabolism
MARALILRADDASRAALTDMLESLGHQVVTSAVALSADACAGDAVVAIRVGRLALRDGPDGRKAMRDLLLGEAPRDASQALPDDWLASALPAAVERLERALIGRALACTSGNRAAAARRLGIHRQLLYRKLAQYGIA